MHFTRTLAVVAALGGMGLAAVPAEARDRYYGEAKYQSEAYVDEVKTRLKRQKKRIRRLWEDGLLSRSDVRDLKHRVHYIRDELKYACDDDIVTRRERNHLHNMLDRNSRRIASYRFGGGHARPYGAGLKSYKDDGYATPGYRDEGYLDGDYRDVRGREYRSGY